MEETVPVIIDGEQEPDTKQEVSGLSTNPQVIPMKVKCQTDGCDMSFPTVEEFSEHVKKAHLKEKHAGGRPCEFCQRKDEVLKITREYIDSGKGEKPRMLYLGELAMKLDIYRELVTEWVNKKLSNGEAEHPELQRMIKELESVQETRLQQRLMGRYNPTGAIFLLKTKHKYIETEKQILVGDKNEPLEISFTEDKKHKYE